jgi:DNA-binding transcriptional regulator YiaG
MLHREQRPRVQGSTLSVEERSYYAELIEQLKARRKALGFSQLMVDDLIGVSEGMVAKWETAVRFPSGFFLMCWCKALDVRLCIERNARA